MQGSLIHPHSVHFFRCGVSAEQNKCRDFVHRDDVCYFSADIRQSIVKIGAVLMKS